MKWLYYLLWFFMGGNVFAAGTMLAQGNHAQAMLNAITALLCGVVAVQIKQTLMKD